MFLPSEGSKASSQLRDFLPRMRRGGQLGVAAAPWSLWWATSLGAAGPERGWGGIGVGGGGWWFTSQPPREAKIQFKCRG